MDETKTPTRRAGIQPLCPFHLDAMIPPADKTTDYFSCRRPFCGLRWGAATDYFRFLDEKPFRTPQQEEDETLCPQPGHGHMFISEIGIGNAVWECSVEGCTETQQKRIPQPPVWAIPKNQNRSADPVVAATPAAIYTQGPPGSRPAANPAPGARKRPGWVWPISLFYALGFLVLVRFIIMYATGALPVSARVNEYLANLGALGIFMALFQPLLSLAAAVALIMLRKEAVTLFRVLLVFAISSNLWTFAIKNGVNGVHAKSGPMIGAVVGIGIQLAVCFYAEQLKMQGTLR